MPQRNQVEVRMIDCKKYFQEIFFRENYSKYHINVTHWILRLLCLFPILSFTIDCSKTSQKSSFGSLENPYPLGTIAELSNSDDVRFEFMIEKVIYGDSAWDIIHKANFMTQKVSGGKERILVKLRAKNVSQNGTLKINSSWEMSVIIRKEVIPVYQCSVPSLEDVGLQEFDRIELMSGGVFSGWLALIRYKNDDSACLNINYKADEPLCFRLK